MAGRRKGWSVAAAGVLVLGMVGAAASASGSSSMSSPSTLQFQAHTEREASIDLGRAGRSLGDEQVLAGLLYDRTGATRVGTFRAVCVVTSRSPVKGECSMTARVAGKGQITSQGYSQIPLVGFTNGVTGGTGIFQNTRGQVSGKSVTPAITDLEYQVLP